MPSAMAGRLPIADRNRQTALSYGRSGAHDRQNTQAQGMLAADGDVVPISLKPEPRLTHPRSISMTTVTAVMTRNV